QKVERGAGVAQLSQRAAQFVQPGRVVIVADPGFEQIAQYIQRIGAARRGLQKPQAGAQQVRLTRLQMQIGNEQSTHAAVQALSSTTTAFSITTSSAGTS